MNNILAISCFFMIIFDKSVLYQKKILHHKYVNIFMMKVLGNLISAPET